MKDQLIYGLPELPDKRHVLKKMRHQTIFDSWLPYKSSLGGCHLYRMVVAKGPTVEMLVPVSIPKDMLADMRWVTAEPRFSPSQQARWTKLFGAGLQ